MNEGFLFTPFQILIAIHEVLVDICNGNHVWHVLVAFWVFGTQKCEVVIYAKFGSACVPARPLKHLDALVLHRAHVPCMCEDVMHARHDVTRFAYNVNHIIMMSYSHSIHAT